MMCTPTHSFFWPHCSQLSPGNQIAKQIFSEWRLLLRETSLWSPYTESLKFWVAAFSTWQSNNLIPTIGLVSHSSYKGITSKLCFISQRHQSKTMNNGSQGTKSEPGNLSWFNVSAVVQIHRELVKIRRLVKVPILWLLAVKWLD